MNDNDNSIERLSPQKLLQTFAHGKVIRCVLAAVAIHVLIIGAMSTHYIYVTWVNPEALNAEQGDDAAGATNNPGGVATTPTGSSNETAPTTEPATVTPKPANDGDREIVEKHGDKPTAKAITDAATPDEIPDLPTPGGLGISLEDTQ